MKVCGLYFSKIFSEKARVGKALSELATKVPAHKFHEFPDMKDTVLSTQMCGKALYVCLRDGSLFKVTMEEVVEKARFSGKIDWLNVLSAKLALVFEDGQLKKVNLATGGCTGFLKFDFEQGFCSRHTGLWQDSIILYSRGELFQIDADKSSSLKICEEEVSVTQIQICQDFLILNANGNLNIWDLKNQTWHRQDIPVTSSRVKPYPTFIAFPGRILSLYSREEELFPLPWNEKLISTWSYDRDYQNLLGISGVTTEKGGVDIKHEYLACYNIQSRKLKKYKFFPYQVFPQIFSKSEWPRYFFRNLCTVSVEKIVDSTANISFFTILN